MLQDWQKLGMKILALLHIASNSRFYIQCNVDFLGKVKNQSALKDKTNRNFGYVSSSGLGSLLKLFTIIYTVINFVSC